MRVDELVCHTHPPPPTGPSKADFEMLKVLNQSQSIIFEINGDPDGVVFRLLQKRGDT
jgi:proteasome lid subunit RPN8/RPN11